MPAITVGFSEFEARLDTIRRRLNLLSLQDAACITGTAWLVAATVVMISTLAASNGAFSWVLRSAAAASILALVAAGWNLHRCWLNREETAFLIDRRADLDARVSTMLAHAAAAAPSRLRSILLWQLFELGPRWQLNLIAPRKLRWPTFALLAASLLFAATALLLPEKPPEPPAAQPSTNAPAAVTNTNTRQGPSLNGTSGRPGRNPADVGREQGEGEGEGTAPPSQRGAGDYSRGNLEKRSGRDQVSGLSKGEQRAMPRDSREDGASPSELHNGKRNPDAPPTNAARSIAKPMEQLPQTKRNPETEAKPPRANTAKDSATRSTAPSTKLSNGRGGSKAATGDSRVAKRGGGKNLLSKKAAAPISPAETVEPMLIRLRAFAASPALRMERQGGQLRSPALHAAGGEPPPQPIAENQEPNRLPSRSVITRAHRDLMRELFTPDAP